MTEESFFWAGEIVGDASLAPYSADEYTDVIRKILMRDRTTQGVIEDYLNELLVSNPAGLTIRVATGAAIVDGNFYENDANVDNAILAPALANRYDRVILRKGFAAQTVRVAILTGIEGGGVPALTQNDGVTWEVPLATILTTPVPVITLTDERAWVRSPLAPAAAGAMHHIATLEGDGSSPLIDFQNIVQTYRHLFGIGQCRMDGAIVEAEINARLNNDAGVNYNNQEMVGNNNIASAAAMASDNEANLGMITAAIATANYPGQFHFHIPFYTETDFVKTLLGEGMHISDDTVGADWEVGEFSALWKNTAAITRLTFLSVTGGAGNFDTGSRISLYGLD